MTLRSRGARRLALLLVAPLLSACLDNESLGTRPDPAGGTIFRNYVALGTSIGAGIQSGGINDSTQQKAYPYLLAQAMGLTPGVDWMYPSLNAPGCPAPYTSILTGARVGGASATACALRAPGSAAPFMNNVGIPSLRIAQILDVTAVPFAATDTLKLAQLISGSVDPIEHVRRAHATFVTLEVGANDVLGAATRGDSTLLTPTATFQSLFTTIADSLTTLGAVVAVANIPNVTVIPHFSLGVIFYCLRNAGCPPPLPSPTLPYSLPTFTVDASCAPSAFGGVGDSMLVAFNATGAITSTLAAGRQASLNCGTASALVATGGGAPSVPVGAVLSKATVKAIATRVVTLNTIIASEAGTRGWALLDLNAALAAQVTAGNIPAFPNFSAADPNLLFGTLISQDGIHPNAAGHRLIAQGFAGVINTTYGTALTVP